jgi:hypothetical protein
VFALRLPCGRMVSATHPSTVPEKQKPLLLQSRCATTVARLRGLNCMSKGSAIVAVVAHVDKVDMNTVRRMAY